MEPIDWPKLRDMSKARYAKTRQRKFPVGIQVRVGALILLFINIFTVLFSYRKQMLD